MILDKLSIINFKNIREEQLSLSEGINCFVGDNGAGKTNILDAIHYLSMARSMHTITDSQSVCHGEEGFIIDGGFRRDDMRPEQIVCGYTRRSGKTLKRNGKEYDKLSDHVGHFPIVVVSPADTALISDSAEERRRYINRLISQIDRQYLAALIRYNTTLQERNKLLKNNPAEEMLLIYDQMMDQAATAIYNSRKEVIAQMRPIVEEYYAQLSGGREKIGIEYRSELEHTPLSELLLAARQKDIINEHTTVGIHRDDIAFTIGDYPLRKYGSQGQQKSFVIAIKLAQFDFNYRKIGHKPILLLDDIFDKLDDNRVAQLVKLVGNDHFGQVFITDTQRQRIKYLMDNTVVNHKIFKVNNGIISTDDE